MNSHPQNGSLANHPPFVLFRIKAGLYAVSSRHVREIVTLPQVTCVPQTPAAIRGVINLRGRIIPLLDLRLRLGLAGMASELAGLIQLLRDREQDHRNWLAELEGCVREHRPFGLARDPHQCKFGLWYDAFRNDDHLLGMILPSMDAPHQAIHATADRALELAAQGQEAAALELIEARRQHELGALIKLFAEARRTLAEGHREVGVVLALPGRWLAITADQVEAVEEMPEVEEERCRGLGVAGNSGNFRVGKRAKTNQTVILLEDEFFSESVGTN